MFGDDDYAQGGFIYKKLQLCFDEYEKLVNRNPNNIIELMEKLIRQNIHSPLLIKESSSCWSRIIKNYKTYEETHNIINVINKIKDQRRFIVSDSIRHDYIKILEEEVMILDNLQSSRH